MRFWLKLSRTAVRAERRVGMSPAIEIVSERSGGFVWRLCTLKCYSS